MLTVPNLQLFDVTNFGVLTLNVESDQNNSPFNQMVLYWSIGSGSISNMTKPLGNYCSPYVKAPMYNFCMINMTEFGIFNFSKCF
jgi:hypothetical protein